MNALPGQGGGLSAFKAGLATGNTVGGAGGAQAPAKTTTPFSPPTPRTAPPQVSVAMPQGPQAAMFSPGSTIHGRVAAQENGQFTLRLGDMMMKAESRVPLKVGDAVQFQVQGENKGQVHLKLVSTPFEKMSMNDISQTLTTMKMPMDEKSLTLAKTMVELKIPLTKENLSELKTSLAQTAPQANGAPASSAAPLPNRVAATSFLQNSGLPVTPQSVGVLSNFMANNPQIGQQLASVNTEFKKLNEVSHKMSKELNEMVSQVQSGMGKLSLDPPKTGDKKEGGNLAGLKNMAQQAGLESKTNMGPGGFGGGEEWDFPAMIRSMRERAEAEGVGSEDLLAMMEGLEQNIEAQQLINAAHPESMIGYYYMQLPINFPGFRNAEVWLQYTEEGGGRRKVDPEETRLEFFVNTDEMGELHFVVDIRKGKVHVDLGTPSGEVRQFAARYLPALAERIAGLGWETGRFRAQFRPHAGKRELVEHTDFASLERFNVHA